MKLLKNQQEFEEWKSDKTCKGDKVRNPKLYPCYVYLRVLDWNSEDEESIYLYRTDIEKMLMSLLPPNATVKNSML